MSPCRFNARLLAVLAAAATPLFANTPAVSTQVPAQSLAAARPVLVTPMAHDQFDNAARVVRLGVGEGLPFADVNARRLTALLERLTHEPRYAGVAAVLGPKIVAEDGAKRAAQLIDERFARALSRRSLPLV